MVKIFKELSRHWRACILIFLLLLTQAYCDLTLPSYTSNIVDIGITQRGIEYAVPQTIRKNALEVLQNMVTEDDRELLETSYTEQEDGIMKLNDSASIEELEDILAVPEMFLYLLAGQVANGADLSQMMSGGMTSDSMMSFSSGNNSVSPGVEDYDKALEISAMLPQGIADTISDMIKDLDETIQSSLKSRSVQTVILEYQAQGISSDVQIAYLIKVGLQMLGFTLLMVLVSVMIGYISSHVGAGIGRDLRKDVFTRVVGFSAAETDRFSTASLITRTTNDIQQVQMVCILMLRMVLYAPILAAGGIFKVFKSGANLSWIIITAVIALLGLMLVLFTLAMPKFKLMQSLVDQLNLISREILTGIMPIRAFSRERHEEERFDKANKDLMQTQLFTNRVMAFMFPGMTLIMNALSLAIVWFGGHQIADGNMQTGEMIAFITYSMQIVMSFLMLTMVAIFLPRAGVAADRIDEVLNTEASIHDPEKDVKTKKEGVVRFSHVNFRYPGGEADALHDIDFVAEPGKTTAIIGSTGCGKSTLLNLIPRFYDVTGGELTIDDVNVRDMKQSDLRDMLGYVPQKGVLFSGTIESNLKFGGPSIDDDSMRKAASIAQASDFIEAKNEGYQEHIAQGGTNVSGGQKQRLAIARAIAKNPKIYLFDDSFSALDYKTDVVLRRALKEETSDATVIIVAQRISTVLHAEQIIVLDEGRIVGKGTHEQLMLTCPEYQDIARSQLSEKELSKTVGNTMEKTQEGGDR